VAYDGKILNRALRRLEEDRQRRQDSFQARRESIFRRQPRLRRIEEELNSTMSRIITQALRQGADPRGAVSRLRDENLALQAEKKRLLAELNLPEDILDEKPACSLCNDTGLRGEVYCRCVKPYYMQEQKKELSRMLDLGSQSFDTFSLDWYSEEVPEGKPRSARAQMERVYNHCAEFAHGFGRKAQNLLLFGAPGLGKTHLSAAIAREVSEKGFSVVYDTAMHVFERFEQQKFGREDGETVSSDVSRILTADLLILDDLGTEMTTAFVQSALYQIINTRLLEKKATIISTNLSPAQLAQRYTLQIASRLEGEYEMLPFVGEDIRKQKKARR